MIDRSIFTQLLFIPILFLVSCDKQAQDLSMGNPASVNCEQKGGSLELRQDPSGGVMGICHFSNGSECEEWAFYRGECTPAGESKPEPEITEDYPLSLPTEIPTAIPTNPDDYQGWWTYSNSDYGFTIMLPEDWVVDESTASDSLMNGHFLTLHPQPTTGTGMNIRMAFRRVGEDVLLWPTGVGAGSFVPQGNLDIGGNIARRIMFICPDGQVNAIWYHGADEIEPNIRIDEMEFGIIANISGSYCEEGISINAKDQYAVDLIIASLRGKN